MTAKVYYVKKARKNNPAVKKGNPYYWWKFRFGPIHYSKEPPRRSQLTQSAYFASLYDIEDAIEEIGASSTIEDLTSTLDAIINDIEDLKSTTEDSLDNIPDNLKDAPTGTLLQERIDALQEWIDELEGVDVEFDEEEMKREAEEEADKDDKFYADEVASIIEQKKLERMEAICAEIQGVSHNAEI
jgi:hypothetical protein